MTDYERAMKSVHVPFIQAVIMRLDDELQIENLVDRVYFLTEGFKHRPDNPRWRFNQIMLHTEAWQNGS
jgi:hypothetical protein